MEPVTFSTASLEPGHQYQAWREWFHPLLEIAPSETHEKGFAAENMVWKLDDVVISRVFAPATRVSRTKSGIRRNSCDHWVLTYCREGTTSLSTDEKTLEAPMGVPFVWSLRDESKSERTAVDRMQVFLPRDSFQGLAPVLDSVRGSVIRSPLGHLLGDFLASMELRLPELNPEDAPRLASAIRGMVAACISPSADRSIIAKAQIDASRMERVRQVVFRNLRSPTLAPSTLCRLAGLSRSNLYRLLDRHGGAAHYIQTQRLLEAHARLSDTSSRTSIATIAEELSFSDASSFARAFKREFGHTPGEARAEGVLGICLASPLVRSEIQADHFSDFMAR